MSFANPLPAWLLALAVGGIAVIAYGAYFRLPVPVTSAQRVTLSGLRFLSLLAILVFLLRPVRVVQVTEMSQAVVPVLLDTSRSMALSDADGRPRLQAAVELIQTGILPRLEPRFQIDVIGFGDRVAPIELDAVAATARRSDLERALAAVRERYRDRDVAGIVLLSDGADTSGSVSSEGGTGPRVFPIGVGAAAPLPDRELLAVSVGQPHLDDALVDLTVAAVSHGFGVQPFDVRVLEGDRVVHARRLTPPADGGPVQERFRVLPRAGEPTTFTVEIGADRAELTEENNRQSVLVSPPGRKRRLLVVEGGPGFEHSFLKRAIGLDPGIEVDSVVRKGQDERGADTYLVQAASGRARSLAQGYPAAREALFAYDGIVLANIESDTLSRDQLEMTAAFVAERGGGLLVMGSRAFDRGGLTGTALEEALPLELSDRTGAALGKGPVMANHVALTREGESHPIMQLGDSAQESARAWASMPALASSVALGAARPGASILALTSGPGGAARPLVAVQPFGRGRTMVFAGEGAWRWRMMLPTSDHGYENFWRQAGRWLTVEAPDPVSIRPPTLDVGEPGDVRIDVRDARYVPVSGAAITATVTDPSGTTYDLRPSVRNDAAGELVASFTPDEAGVYRFDVSAEMGEDLLGSSSAAILVGGRAVEMLDPRRHDDVLGRLAARSGGRVLAPADLESLPDLLAQALAGRATTVQRDVWHTPWALGLVVLALAGEWLLRRRWGLR